MKSGELDLKPNLKDLKLMTPPFVSFPKQISDTNATQHFQSWDTFTFIRVQPHSDYTDSANTKYMFDSYIPTPAPTSDNILVKPSTFLARSKS